VSDFPPQRNNPALFFRQGERARQKSRFAEALAFYRRAQTAYKKARDTDGERNALLGVGDCLRMLGQFTQAKQAYARASASRSLWMIGKDWQKAWLASA
jgi:hypothetical protein